MISTATQNTRILLGGDAFPQCESVSLRLEKFVRIGKEEGLKKDEVLRVCEAHGKHAHLPPSMLHVPASVSLFVKLNSRLIVNQAGGVLENAGICLHRHFGLPYIPGSAVKGCARRMAIQKILEAKSSKAKAELVFNAALVFGWGDNEWKEGRNKHDEFFSDFVYASTQAESTPSASFDDVRQKVCSQLAVLTGDANRKDYNPEQPWKSLSSFAGLVSFLAAYPTAKPKLVSDVLTCHHMDYYGGRSDSSADTESPNPQFFLAVEAGTTFLFQIVPSRRASRLSISKELNLAEFAQTCLNEGLDTFGIGAKTNAGYGWLTLDQQAVEAHATTKAKAMATIDDSLLTQFRSLRPDQFNGAINSFSLEQKYWTNKDASYQRSILHFCTIDKPDIWAQAKTNPKGKIFKAISNLATAFGINPDAIAVGVVTGS